MDRNNTAALEQLARDVGLAVAGPGVVEVVKVEPGLDSLDQLTYEVFFRIDADRAPMRIGLLLSRLSQGIRDELLARGDTTFPMPRLLDPVAHRDPQRA